jgi:hypothetical protein
MGGDRYAVIAYPPGKSTESDMQDKQKVTLYLPPGLHRQLKIRSALDTESMSAMVEKAICFYLKHPEMVEEVGASHGKTHQVHICPECESALVMRDGQMVALKNQPSILAEDLPREVQEKVKSQVNDSPKTPVYETDSQGEEELVPC